LALVAQFVVQPADLVVFASLTAHEEAALAVRSLAQCQARAGGVVRPVRAAAGVPVGSAPVRVVAPMPVIVLALEVAQAVVSQAPYRALAPAVVLAVRGAAFLPVHAVRVRVAAPVPML
jgi:hypothetical protein